jgi:hypothetical protein
MKNKMRMKIAIPTSIHLPLLPKSIGIGPRKSTPNEFLFNFLYSSPNFKLWRIKRNPTPVNAIPKPSKGVDTIISISLIEG